MIWNRWETYWSICIHSLEKRREEWAQEEEEKIRNTPDPDMPPGHKLMPATERDETLKLLQQSKLPFAHILD